MPLSANLLKLKSSILPRAKRATNRNNVATDKRIQKKKVLAPDSLGAEMSSAETAAPKRTRPWERSSLIYFSFFRAIKNIFDGIREMQFQKGAREPILEG